MTYTVYLGKRLIAKCEFPLDAALIVMSRATSEMRVKRLGRVVYNGKTDAATPTPSAHALADLMLNRSAAHRRELQAKLGYPTL